MPNQLVTVKEVGGVNTDLDVLGFGRQNAANSKSWAWCNEDKTDLTALVANTDMLVDWNETGRAAVNLIASQVGIDGGAGNYSLKTVRVVHSADDPMYLAILGAAHGASAASVNPSMLGLYAANLGANPADVTAGQATRWYGLRNGLPFVMGGHPNILTREWVITDADGAQTNAQLLTVGGGVRIVVTQAQMVMSGANTGEVAGRLGLSGTGLSAPSPTTGIGGIILSGKFSKNGGLSRGTGAAIIAIGGDGDDLVLTCDDPAGGDIRILVSYFTITG